MERKGYIVALRILATLAVVANHTILVALGTMSTSSWSERFLTHGIVNFVHFAVPLFVMITGSLLLDKRKAVSFEKAFTKYAWRMIVILLTIGLAFCLMEDYFENHSVSISLFAKSLYNLAVGKSWEHMWYVYMLIGLYLVLPFIKSGVNQSSLKQIDYFIITLFVFTSLIPLIGIFTDFRLGIKFPICSEYVLYLLLGYRLTCDEDETDERAPLSCLVRSGGGMSWIILLTLSVLLVGVSFLEYFPLPTSVGGLDKLHYLAEYNSPIEVFLGIAIFRLCFMNRSKFDKIEEKRIIRIMDQNSFGIYLFHMFWINILYKVFKFNPFEINSLLFVVVYLFVLLASIVTSVVYRRIPVVGKYI